MGQYLKHAPLESAFPDSLDMPTHRLQQGAGDTIALLIAIELQSPEGLV